MKEQLYTIPLNDAVNANDECPFCFIERAVIRDLIDFVLGSGASYMEADMRDITDAKGFCRNHFKMLFDYGNTLGNAWILKTHTAKMIGEYRAKTKNFKPGALSLADKLKKKKSENQIVSWLKDREKSCYICEEFDKTYDRYLDTFFYLWKNDDSFRDKIEKGKGMCFAHFTDVCEGADVKLSQSELERFYEIMLPLQEKNLRRINEDVSWMVEKFDYRNKDADWKNSKDSIQRSMQKLKGGYPADSPYKHT